ncbi:hypothetical protein ACFQZO_14245 [Bradyrhizobium sp. GCM10027634]|uniref:hypothetical protein n=1 Tax=unclassified Bradyrhizobium TaxID=2631580 RepID=UPI00188B2073|nr:MULTISPECIES: hypothetical protein [unclassified Bradyrhizobium]MDN5002049.1 hypothetical protein [Bradyrhizobium sp. WYCCWR 12677]QOZ45677.1 hypothetical protein XH89_20990 [Bradyrhizobium sp. CCBAU 53340]
MRAAILVLVPLALTSAARAETLRLPPAGEPQAGKALPLKGTTGTAKANSCASYGRGFYWVEATSTCVKIGGSVSVGTAVRR